MNLDGKQILITGATSGIGMATAESCARDGAKVIGVGRNAERGEQLLNTLAGAGHTFLACDLADRNQAQDLIGAALETTDRLDVLINSAGVVHHCTVPDTSNDVWEHTIGLNLNTVFYLCRDIIPHMQNKGGGCIVNVASTWGLVGAEQTAAYCTSKGGVIQLTRCMAADHAKHNIRINAVCPGAVDTPMLAAEASAFGISPDQGKELWAADAANNKLARAQDIADTIMFLISDQASHIHGIALPVDGGTLAT